MAQQGDFRHEGELARIRQDRLGIGDFTGDRHVDKLAFALAVCVEIKAKGGHARLGKGARNRRDRVQFLFCDKPVHQHDQRAGIFLFVKAFRQDQRGGEPSMRPEHLIGSTPR